MFHILNFFKYTFYYQNFRFKVLSCFSVNNIPGKSWKFCWFTISKVWFRWTCENKIGNRIFSQIQIFWGIFVIFSGQLKDDFVHIKEDWKYLKSNTTQSNRKLSGWFLNKIGFHNPLFAFLRTWQAIEINNS